MHYFCFFLILKECQKYLGDRDAFPSVRTRTNNWIWVWSTCTKSTSTRSILSKQHVVFFLGRIKEMRSVWNERIAFACFADRSQKQINFCKFLSCSFVSILQIQYQSLYDCVCSLLRITNLLLNKTWRPTLSSFMATASGQF